MMRALTRLLHVLLPARPRLLVAGYRPVASGRLPIPPHAKSSVQLKGPAK